MSTRHLEFEFCEHLHIVDVYNRIKFAITLYTNANNA